MLDSGEPRTLLTLPAELLALVAKLANSRCLAKLASTCTTWREASQDALGTAMLFHVRRCMTPYKGLIWLIRDALVVCRHDQSGPPRSTNSSSPGACTFSCGGRLRLWRADGTAAFRHRQVSPHFCIPEDLATVFTGSFAGCTTLTTLTLPAAINSIKDDAFSHCTALASLTLPASLTFLGAGAFSGCLALTSLTLPATLTRIGDGAFSGCTALTSVILPAALTSLGKNAFSGCTALTSLTLPSALSADMEIGKNAFNGSGVSYKV